MKKTRLNTALLTAFVAFFSQCSFALTIINGTATSVLAQAGLQTFCSLNTITPGSEFTFTPSESCAYLYQHGGFTMQLSLIYGKNTYVCQANMQPPYTKMALSGSAGNYLCETCHSAGYNCTYHTVDVWAGQKPHD